MIKNLKLFFILILSLILVTGCWDSQDLNKKNIITAVGVDKVGDNYEFVVESAKTSTSITKSKEEADIVNVYITTATGKNFEEAREKVDSKSPRLSFLGATRVVVFGENYAKSGLTPYLNRINKTFDYRKTVLAVISRESPEEIFNQNIESAISVGFFIENNIEYLANTGETLYPTIGEMLSDIALGEVGFVLPYIGIEDNKIEYLGLAAMSRDKLVGTVKKDNTDGILYLLAKNPLFIEVLQSPEKKENLYSFRIRINKRKIKTDYIDENIVINIELDLNAELRYQYNIEAVSEQQIKQLEKRLSEKIKNKIVYMINRTQKVCKCDIFDFARYFRADNPKIYRQIHWSEEYPEAKVNVKVNTFITDLNLSDPGAETKY
ncbi:Ger(x)C family spore germination protein [Caldisalinibacter kiritimatiensis]|uniref:Spore germination protein GerKC n=1 Tax=Caldisalinibacter kiritimatiensis TaxID=1304284 RepID=R1CMF1_9FIRM|nr:Ger(x)C family spore germination protein [Caldisalinibacter kiritimatiensis]EOC99880.1 hypothetical protein L21TH_2083 [Caldisalinibacter kiritimatiensis]